MHPASVAAVLLLLAQACSGEPAPRFDAEAEDELDAESTPADVVADETPRDAEDTPPSPGPSTHVAYEIEALSDRVCDHDDDGIMDNAIADLGTLDSQLFLAALNSLYTDPRDARTRMVMHAPLLDDANGLSDEAANLIVCQVLDADEPDDRSDDFSGEEPFLVRAISVDPCGEPLSLFPETVFDGGRVRTTRPGAIHMVIPGEFLLKVSAAEATATIEPNGGQGEWLACGLYLIDDLGGSIVPGLGGEDVSFLEAVLAGGAAFGMPTVPGITPDVDLDGDGLERFILDDDGRITTCIDGDLSPIEGRDCWQDERINDAISMSFRFGTVPAKLLGLEPGWEAQVVGTCDAPPEESVWDPS